MLKYLCFLISIQQIFASSCNVGFSKNRIEGLQDKYFMSYPLTANWYHAHQFCTNMGQQLLTIPSADVQEELEAYIMSLKLNHKFNIWYEGIWTAGTDNGLDGSFFWMTNGNDIGPYKNFKIGEPNGGGGENCLSLWNWNQNGYEWNDTPCHIKLYFICERKSVIA